MKGYTNVSVDDIKAALDNWKAKYNHGEVIRDKGIELYYEKYYTKGNWFTKLINRSKTPYDFARKRIAMFSVWNSILGEFLDKEELDTLELWSYSLHKEAYIAVKALLNAAASGDILLDNELCWFINKYKGERNVFTRIESVPSR